MIKSVRIKNFKAIKDSGTIKLGWLTVFVGHNGTGKSSVIEALEFFKNHATRNVTEAVEPWYDFDHILWQGIERKPNLADPCFSSPMEIGLTGKEAKGSGVSAWSAETKFSKLAGNLGKYRAGAVVPQSEELTIARRLKRHRKIGGPMFQQYEDRTEALDIPPDASLFRVKPAPDLNKWLFLSLEPSRISAPQSRKHAPEAGLDRTGGNLAQYLRSFIEQDPDGYKAMIAALGYIIPYAVDVQPEETSDLINQMSFIRLVEDFENGGHVKLPGWVLSGGTLRILSILTALRHPQPPSVLFIEELENGLDPRALGFIVEEIRYAVESQQTQVIATTHSPYLLDKLLLSHVVTVDRIPGQPPVFSRAADHENLRAWSEKFAPGSLYTMGMFRNEGGRK
jgi:predicted ATPase